MEIFVTSAEREKEYFANLNEKVITNNRKFWYSPFPFWYKPFLSDKIKSRKNIIYVHNMKITSDEVEVANTLNNFFSNVVKNVKLLENKLPHSLSRHPTLKFTVKYKNH